MAQAFKVTVKGMKALRSRVKREGAKGQDAVRAALYQFAAGIYSSSILRTPVDYGFLRRSAFVTKPVGGDNFIEVGYGVDYALAVHEIDAFHKTGERFFLRNAFREAFPRAIAFLAKNTWRNIEKGIGLGPAQAPTRPKLTGDPGKGQPRPRRGGKGK